MVTAGPTQENIDPVRYITNHSSGKMGYAVAKAAMLRGADVTLVSGQTALIPPMFVNKLKKKEGHMAIELERTRDILAYLGEHKKENQFLCGFSMETENMRRND